MYRVIFHLDMDAFYAAVEQRDFPYLRGKPVIVGSPPTERGVVSAASYEARRFGVHSAMPSKTAGRLCPNGVFVRPRMEVYKAESREVLKAMRESGAAVEQVSIDEAYLDMSSVCQGEDADASLYHGVPIAKALKRRIYEERRLTATIGIAANKMMAKLASDYDKPDGLTLIPERDKVGFLAPLPIRVIHGVGRVTERHLQGHGIHTVGDLQARAGDLKRLLGSFGLQLKGFAFGEDDRAVETEETIKSFGSENTFDEDTADRRILTRCLWEEAQELAGKLWRHELGAETIQVKVRYSDFTTLTRQMTLREPIHDAGSLYRMACHLLAREKLVRRPLRLLGLAVSRLVPWAEQQLLFPFMGGHEVALERGGRTVEGKGR